MQKEKRAKKRGKGKREIEGKEWHGEPVGEQLERRSCLCFFLSLWADIPMTFTGIHTSAIGIHTKDFGLSQESNCVARLCPDATSLIYRAA
jgi:hypothetical protein